jgi:hypothetical protein
MYQSTKNKKRHFLLLPLFIFSLCWPMGAAAGEIIGTVATVMGTAYVTREGTPERTRVQRGHPTHLLDTYETGAGSRLKILLEDDTVINLGERSKIVMTQRVYTKIQVKQNRIIDLITGSIRVLVGRPLVKGRSKFEVHTPVSTAGVRGTYFIVWIHETEKRLTSGTLVLEGEVIVKPVSDKSSPGFAGNPLRANSENGGIILGRGQTIWVRQGDDIGESLRTLRIAPPSLTASLLEATEAPHQIDPSRLVFDESNIAARRDREIPNPVDIPAQRSGESADVSPEKQPHPENDMSINEAVTDRSTHVDQNRETLGSRSQDLGNRNHDSPGNRDQPLGNTDHDSSANRDQPVGNTDHDSPGNRDQPVGNMDHDSPANRDQPLGNTDHDSPGNRDQPPGNTDHDSPGNRGQSLANNDNDKDHNSRADRGRDDRKEEDRKGKKDRGNNDGRN